MDILILDSWLRDYLKTSAKPEKLAECLSLCGPSVERIEKIGKDKLYHIEITTNRSDTASHYGIAQEALAILPRFKIKSKLLPLKIKSKQKLTENVNYLDAKVDHKLCPRFSAILIRDVKIDQSPSWLQERLKTVGSRPINNIVDISNYLMFTLGQPVHTFDYDKINGHKMVLRAAKRGEKIVTLDGQKSTLNASDIVIEDGGGKIIDLCGIMGGKLSAIDSNTKNVLLFVQTYNPVNIRKTTFSLNKRSSASTLFEKGLDPENIEITIRYGIDLFVEICKGKPESKILDLYPNPYQPKKISLSLKHLNNNLGISISRIEVEKILKPLGFKTILKGETLECTIPSWRAQDIDIPEDIIEEVARIYGFHNLPSKLMTGIIPDPLSNTPFKLELEVKQLLKGWGGIEVYTSSLVEKEKIDIKGDSSWVLKLKNPLGSDSEYLRLSLAPSLVDSIKNNAQENNQYFIFEVANIYLPVRGSLPEEKMMLGVVFSQIPWNEAKGFIDGFLESLKIEASFIPEDTKGFVSSHHLTIKSGKELLGQFGLLENSNLHYLEFDMAVLQNIRFKRATFMKIPKYPPQIEDLSFVWPSKTFVGDVIKKIKDSDIQVSQVELLDIFENSKTFRITYQNPEKTLTNSEVELIRRKILERVSKNFGLKLKN